MNNVYNLYITFGTIPALFAQINVFLDKKPSYVWVRSGGNFNPKDFHGLDNVKYYKKFNCTDHDYIKEQYKDILKKIKFIKKNDKNAKFIIYTDDSRVQFILKPLILSDSYNQVKKLVLVSEGNISQYMYESIKKGDNVLRKTRWNNLKNNINSQQNDKELQKLENYCFWLSTNAKVEYLLPFPDMLYNENISNKYKKTMNLSDLNLEKLYKKLPYEIKNKFNSMEVDNSKKIIIILGTYDFGSKKMTAILYENLINQAMNDYGDKYIFMFKAHPVFPVSENKWLEEYLNSKNIIILPSKTPLEILLWNNDNIMVGGFCSTVNSMIDPLRTKFFFGEKIGYSNLLDKNKKFKANEYGILISQKIANELLVSYSQTCEVKDKIEANKNYFETRYNDLMLKNEQLTQKINYMENKMNIYDSYNSKVDLLEKNMHIINKFLNPIRRFKNKFFNKNRRK